MATFVLTNNKGGVGKSTSTVNLAYGVCQVLKQNNVSNPRVLIVDTDGQAHSTLVTTGGARFGRDDSLYAPLTANREDAIAVMDSVIVQSIWDEDLHVLPGSSFLDNAERELFSIAGNVYRLGDALKNIARNYAAVFIDTRPSFSLMTEMALVAATDVLIPLEASYLETVGLQNIINKVQEIRDGWRVPDLRVSGVFVTKLDRRSAGQMKMVEGFNSHPTIGRLTMGVIPANESVRYAHGNHQSVFDYDPQCTASQAYAELTGRIVKMMYGKVQ